VLVLAVGVAALIALPMAAAEILVVAAVVMALAMTGMAAACWNSDLSGTIRVSIFRR
jgi:hypothetical protein